MKNKYFKRLVDKLKNPTTSSKPYWSIIKSFLITGVSPPILVNDKIMANLMREANIFNEFFNKRC